MCVYVCIYLFLYLVLKQLKTVLVKWFLYVNPSGKMIMVH